VCVDFLLSGRRLQVRVLDVPAVFISLHSPHFDSNNIFHVSTYISNTCFFKGKYQEKEDEMEPEETINDRCPAPVQIIGLGLPRTGTASLRNALNFLGFGPCCGDTLPFLIIESWES